MDNVALPRVTDKEMYAYLGTKIGGRKVGAAVEVLDSIVADLTTVAESDLKPQQKLHALRTFLLPRASYVLQHSSNPVKEVSKADDKILKLAKNIACLPTKAITSYVRAPRSSGALGVASLIELQARHRLSDAVLVSQMQSECGVQVRRRMLEVARSAFPAYAAHEALALVLNGEGIFKAVTLGWLGEVRAAAAFVRRHLQQDISINVDTNGTLHLLVDAIEPHNAWKALKAAFERHHFRSWCAAPNQGRFAEVIGASYVTSKLPYSFRFPFADWRFVHKARLNLSPLLAAITWTTGNKTCRRCNGSDETVAHVLSSCPAHKTDILARHKAVLSCVADRLPKSKTQVLVEQRQGNVVPDLVVKTADGDAIIDIKVSCDFKARFLANACEVRQKYDALSRLYTTATRQATVDTVQLGLLCTHGPSTLSCLRRAGLNKRLARSTLRKLAVICCHSARNTMTEHLTGVRQLY